MQWGTNADCNKAVSQACSCSLYWLACFEHRRSKGCRSAPVGSQAACSSCVSCRLAAATRAGSGEETTSDHRSLATSEGQLPRLLEAQPRSA